MTPLRSAARAPTTWPVVVLLLLAMCSFQIGAALGKQLLPLVGAEGATTLRLTLSAVILAALMRPWRGELDRRSAAALVLFGGALAALNTLFYFGVQTIPLGIAVAITFVGPLSVAVILSRRLIDLVWVGLAIGGLALLMPVGPVAALDPVGVLDCLGAAACWALYMVAGSRLGARVPSGRAAALGVAVGALCILPFGLTSAGGALFSLALLPIALVVAVLSSALPNSLEMVAMARLPIRVYGILTSLEPALGALFGWLILGETVTLRQGVAIALIVLASAGVTLTAARPTPADHL